MPRRRRQRRTDVPVHHRQRQPGMVRPARGWWRHRPYSLVYLLRGPIFDALGEPHRPLRRRPSWYSRQRPGQRWQAHPPRWAERPLLDCPKWRGRPRLPRGYLGLLRRRKPLHRAPGVGCDEQRPGPAAQRHQRTQGVSRRGQRPSQCLRSEDLGLLCRSFAAELVIRRFSLRSP